MNVVDVTAYGANPYDNISDHDAFVEAARVVQNGLNSGGAWQLYIPASDGTYYVGKQTTRDPDTNAGQTQYKLGEDVIRLTGSLRKYSLEIAATGAKIKYIDDLYFGSFNSDGSPYNGITTDPSYAATIGSFINLTNCQNVAINGVEVDGNNEMLRRGGQFGDTGYQLDNDGIYLFGCKNVKVINSTLNHFGRDGIMVNDHTTEAQYNDVSQTNNIFLTDSHFDYNGRAGMSWVGGKGLDATKCTFSNTARSINSNPKSLYPNAGFGSNPFVGVNVEAEGGYYARNLAFHGCQIVNNYSRGFISNGDAPFDIKASDISFDDCLIDHVNSLGPAVYNVRPRVTFSKCTILGRIQSCYYATADPDKATKFIDCIIGDRSASGQDVLTNGSGEDFLLNMYVRTKSALFQNCQLTVNKLGLTDSYAHGTAQNIWTTFRNCTFNVRWTQSIPQSSMFSGAVFEGDNAFITPPGTTAYNTLRMRLALVTSDRSDPAKHTLTISTGPSILWVLDEPEMVPNQPQATDNTVIVGKDNNDEAVFMLDNGSSWYHYGDCCQQITMTVREKGVLGVRHNSSYRLNDAATLALDGRFIADDNSSVDLRQYSTWNFGPNSEMYVGKDVSVGGYGMYTTFATCVHGGNPQIHFDSGYCTEGFRYNGTERYITINDPLAKADFGTGAFTMEAFADFYSSRSNTPANVHFATNATYASGTLGSGFDFGVKNGQLYLELPSGQRFQQALTVAPGCHHAAVTRSAQGVITFYWDESPLGAPVSASAVSLAANPVLYLGGRPGDGAFKGSLNEVRLWAVERDAAALTASSDATNGTLFPSRDGASPQLNTLRCYWNLRERNSTQYVTDLAAAFPWERSSGYRGNTVALAGDSKDPENVAPSEICDSVITSKASLAAQEAEKRKDVSLYPNPASGTTTLTGAAASSSVRVMDAMGRVVYTTKTAADGAATLALPTGLPAGLYQVRVGTQSLRLVVE